MLGTLKENMWGMKPNRPLAMQLARRDVPALVFDAINFENIAMTLPEVLTILDGVTVEGHRISDQDEVIHLAYAWKVLFGLVEQDRFDFSKATALKISTLAGKDAALPHERAELGSVTIGEGLTPQALGSIDTSWLEIKRKVTRETDVYDQAIAAFLQIALDPRLGCQSNRLGRFMMNGILLANGFPIINIPFKSQYKFHALMIDFYDTHDMRAMNRYLRGCLNEKIMLNFSW